MTRTSRGIGSLRAAATAAAATLAMASLATLAAIVPATPASASALTTTVVPYAGSALTIPDGNTTGVSASVTVGNIGTIRGVDFQIGGGYGNCLSDGRSVNPGISHPWRSDLVGTLRSPAGTTITLFSHTGADGDDYCGTWFSDAAGSSITTTVDEWSLPLYMPYQPVNALSAFTGQDPQGTWTFTVADTVLNHTGKAQTLNSFKLRVTTGSATNAAPVATADTIVARNTINNVVFQNPGTLANDSDPDGDTILMMPTSRGGGTEFMWDSNGNIPSWTGGTTAGSICGQSFRYKAYDGVTASSAVTVNVACVNGPTANADTYSTPMDQPLAVASSGVLANDVAGGSYPMTALLSQSATHGTLSLASNGGFTFTPTAGYVGPATFKYIASLGFNAQSTAATVTINVQPLTLTNTASVSPAANAAGWRKQATTVSFTCTGGTPTVSCPAPVVLGQGANQSVTRTATDGAGATAAATASGINVDLTAPTIAGTATPTTTSFGTTYAIHWTCADALSGIATCPTDSVVDDETPIVGTATDVAGNQASATVTPVAPTSAGAIPTLVRYTGPAVPIPDGTGSASASVTIGNIGTVRGVDLEVGCSTSGGVTTPGITHPYRSDLVGTLRSPAGTTITLFSHVGSDGDGLCRTWFTDAAGPSITSVVDEANLPWTFPYRPVDPMATFAGEDAQGTWTFTVADADPTISHSGPQSLNGFSLRVSTQTAPQTAPTATADTIVATDGGAVYVTQPSPLTNDSDAEGDALMMVPTTALDDLQWTWAKDGSFTWAYSSTPSGECDKSFQYRAYDGVSWSSPVTTTVECVPAPTATADSYTTHLGQVLHVEASGVLANDHANSAHPLEAVLSTAATHGTASLQPDGSFTFTPAPGYSGPATFGYFARISPWAGSTPVTVTIDVLPTPPNSPPIAQGATVEAPRGVGTHVVLVATDPDGEPDASSLIYEILDAPAKGTLDCNGAHGEDCAYTAAPGSSGLDSFTFRASDGTDASNVATVTLTITNQAPTADPISTSAPRAVATPIALTGNDPNGDPITFHVVDQPDHGTVTCSTAGICSYTSAVGATAPDAFTYAASDGELGSSPTTVSIALTNLAPTADPATLEAGRHVATPVVLTGADPNGDPIGFTIVDQPTKGTVDCTGPTGASCSYTSDVGASGSDSFTFRSSDGDLASSPATISITIVNSAPTANDQSLAAPRGVATAIALSSADPNGDASTFAIATTPTKGTVTCTGPTGASCTYTAAPGSHGTDSFTFTASDGDATSAPGTVTIAITNQAPTANAQAIAANAPTVATPIVLTANDPNGDVLTYQVLVSPAKGTVTCTGASCTYTATPGRTGTDAFAFTATDIDGQASTATVSLTLDDQTPGVFVGDASKLEPDTDPTVLTGPSIPITLTRPAPSVLTVWYATEDGTATAPADYKAWGSPTNPRSITIPAGQVQAFVSPPVAADTAVEGPETFKVRILAVTGGPAYLGSTTGTATIVDSDTGATAQPMLSVDGGATWEGNDTRRSEQFRIVLSRPTPVPITIAYATADGTARAGTDYVRTTGTVTIGAGGMSASVDVRINPNTTAQGDRTFRLDLAVAPSAPVNVRSASAIARILDDD